MVTAAHSTAVKASSPRVSCSTTSTLAVGTATALGLIGSIKLLMPMAALAAAKEQAERDAEAAATSARTKAAAKEAA